MPDNNPSFGKDAFVCPHCGVFADQSWSRLCANGCLDDELKFASSFYGEITNFNVSRCAHCGLCVFWHGGRLEYPNKINIDLPNEDLPEDIKNDYLEAASILKQSPRGSAALLRLCIQKLCIALGQKGKNLNDDIGKLVNLGLPANAIKAMDLLRVVGDNAVHPGQIDLSDDFKTAEKLFKLVNFIAEKTITEPKELNAFYDEIMPNGAKTAVKKRNANN